MDLTTFMAIMAFFILGMGVMFAILVYKDHCESVNNVKDKYTEYDDEDRQ